MGVLFYLTQYEQLYQFSKKISFDGTKRKHDLYNAKMIRYFYYACKQKGCVEIEEFYRLLVTNKQYKNRNSALVLVNCILDYNVEHNIYRVISYENSEESVLSEEIALYNFLMGFTLLILGRYKKALEFLDEAEIR